MLPDPELVAETRSWLTKSRRDLEAARFERTADLPFTGDMAFHAQQAVEKATKAYLTWHGHVFRKTHNLIELGEACASPASPATPSPRASSLPADLSTASPCPVASPEGRGALPG
ncbi:HEPN domain-containing protein [Candidatus Latescibacterota bacterium]